MARKKVKARDQASKKLLLKLFEEGKVPTDPEVKELGYKATTVHGYYSRWKRDKGEVAKSTKLETPLGKGETMGGIDETKSKVALEAEETGKGKETEAEEGEGKGVVELPGLVKGGGIAVKIELSIKTLAYYQLANTIAGNNLSLGDFLDDVTEDFFVGRGKSLGLVKLNSKKEV